MTSAKPNLSCCFRNAQWSAEGLVLRAFALRILDFWIALVMSSLHFEWACQLACSV